MRDNPIAVVLYHDVLCAWCLLADHRLAVLREEYGNGLRFSYRAFPIRPVEVAPNSRETRVFARHYRRVAQEAEGEGIVPDLWLGGDPPTSTLAPLMALEAARLQGMRRRDDFLLALRDAAFRRGINVTRRDVLVEIASRVGLKPDRFVAALGARATEEAVRTEHAEAVARGVRGVPALVIGGDWLVAGARNLSEYREIFSRYLSQRGGAISERLLH